MARYSLEIAKLGADVNVLDLLIAGKICPWSDDALQELIDGDRLVT